MAQQFSNEIYSMIIDNLQAEVSALRRVSLVNKAFSASSRLHLWRRVILKAPRRRSNQRLSSCAKFYEILQPSPTIVTPVVADLVQELCIIDNKASSLFGDVHLPLVLNSLTSLIKLDIFNMSWPNVDPHHLTPSIRTTLQSTNLQGVTIVSSSMPIYLLDDCQSVRTLQLRGIDIASTLAPIVQSTQTTTYLPQPQQMVLDIESSVAEDLWPHIDTSHLQSLVIQLPVTGQSMLTAFLQHGHALQCLGLSYMEDAADYPHPNFNSLTTLTRLLIAFPTWIPAWPGDLANLLQFLNPSMQNLEQVHLYLLVDPPDTFVNEEDQEWHQSSDFLVLDRSLAQLRSPRLNKIRISLCPNSGPAAVADIRGEERIEAELPATRARNILFVDAVEELPWDSMFRS